MVIWGDYLSSIALAMDVTETQAGIMFSLIFTICLIVIGLISTKGKRPEVTVTFISLFTSIFFTFLGWYPIWIGSVLALVISIILAKIISGGI